MNRKTLVFVLAAFVLPLILRFIWFFPGLGLPHSIATPDYPALKLPDAPVSTPISNVPKQAGGFVVIDAAHVNQFQVAQIQTLLDALGQRSAQVEMMTDSTRLRSMLKYASAYVIFSPTSNFSPEEIQLVQEFVGRGGRLAVFTDPTRGQTTYDSIGSPIGSMPDSNFANPVLEPFGITVHGDYLYDLAENEGNFRNVYFETFNRADLTWGLNKVALYGSHSLETNTGVSLLVGSDKTYSSETDSLPLGDSQPGWTAAALSQNGNVLALGDFSFLTPPYNTVADNAVLIDNIADFLLSGTRTYNLSLFPYVFSSSSLDILPTSNVQMTAEMTGMLSTYQRSFSTLDMQVDIVNEAPSGGNLIVLGTFSQADDLDPFVKPFNLKMSNFNEYIEIPGLGKVGKSGNGLLLFAPGKQGNTLILLADSEDDLLSLMGLLISGDLSSCVLQGDLGICSIGYGGSFSINTPTPFPTPTLTGPTPTPSG